MAQKKTLSKTAKKLQEYGIEIMELSTKGKGSSAKLPGISLLISSQDDLTLKLLEETLLAIPEQLETHRKKKWLEAVSFFIERPELCQKGTAYQIMENAKLRNAIMEEFGAFTSEEIAEIGHSNATNKSSLANRWKKKGKIFSVDYRGGTLFPAFQFGTETGKPKAIIGEIIQIFGEKSDGWEICFWLATPTGYLGGKRPVDLMDSEREKELIHAAKREVEDLEF